MIALSDGKRLGRESLVARRKVEGNIVKCETFVNKSNRMENLIGMIYEQFSLPVYII